MIWINGEWHRVHLVQSSFLSLFSLLPLSISWSFGLLDDISSGSVPLFNEIICLKWHHICVTSLMWCSWCFSMLWLCFSTCCWYSSIRVKHVETTRRKSFKDLWSLSNVISDCLKGSVDGHACSCSRLELTGSSMVLLLLSWYIAQGMRRVLLIIVSGNGSMRRATVSDVATTTVLIAYHMMSEAGQVQA